MKNFLNVSLAALVVVAVVFSFGVGKTTKYTNDAWLGVETQTVDDEVAKGFDLPVSHGAIVNDVIEGSPAEEIGLEQGDIIIAFDGKKVTDSDDLIDMIEDHSPQDKVNLTVYREGKEKEIQVTLDRAPKNRHDVVVFHNGSSNRYLTVPTVPPVPSVPGVPAVPKAPLAWYDNNGKGYAITVERGGYIGINIMDLSEQLGAYFGVQDSQGALVTSVEEESPAALAGIKAGDVIVKIDDEKVFGTDDVRDAIQDKEKGEKVNLAVLRDKKDMAFEVAVDENEDNAYNYSYRYNGPDMNIQIPKMKGIWNGSYDDLSEYFNSAEWKDQMRQLEDNLQELKQNLKEQQLEQKQELKLQLDELHEQLKQLDQKIK